MYILKTSPLKNIIIYTIYKQFFIILKDNIFGGPLEKMHPKPFKYQADTASKFLN
jgi:hypothetical protein